MEVTETCDSQGNPTAQIWLAFIHLVGDGVPLDRHKARSFLSSAKIGASQHTARLAARCLNELDQERAFSGEWLFSVLQDEAVREQMFQPGSDVIKPHCMEARQP